MAKSGALLIVGAARSSVEGYQLTIRMEDGEVQTLTQDNPDSQVGGRVTNHA